MSRFSFPPPRRRLRLRSPCLLFFLALACLLAGTAAPGAAQPRPWRLDFDISFQTSRGNQNLSVWNSSVRVRHNRPDLANFDLRLRTRYGVTEVDGERERAQEFYRADLKVDVVPGPLVAPYVSTELRHDPGRDIRLMVGNGAGARYRVDRSDGEGRATIRLAVTRSFEDRRDREPSWRGRWNIGVEGQQTVAEGVEVRHSTSFQPLYDHLAEYMLSIDTRLVVGLTDRVSLSLRHEFERDTDPPRRRPIPDDMVVTAGVGVSF